VWDRPLFSEPKASERRRQLRGVPHDLRVVWHVDLVEIVFRRPGLPDLKKMFADGPLIGEK